MKLKQFAFLYVLFSILFASSMPYAGERGRTSKAIGGGGVRFTEQDLSMLPDIIEVRTRYYLFERTKELEKIMAPYKKKYGYGYGTIHHYGVGQIYLNKLILDPTLTSYKKNYYINRAISEFGFVLDPKKIPKYSELFKKTFLPTVLSKRAEAHMLLNQISNAINDLQMALKINPSYHNAYIKLSKCYMVLGDKDSAKEILKLGE